MPIWKSWTPPRLTITTATYQWTAPYAYDVHERQGNRWTDRGLSGSNLPAVFAANYRTTHNLNLAVKISNLLFYTFRKILLEVSKSEHSS